MSTSLYYYEPFYHFDRFFDEASSPGPQNRRQGAGFNTAIQAMKPRMDLHEDQSKNTVTATFELPGLKKEDVQIDLNNGQLTISGESKISSEHEQEGYLIRERGFGKVSRTLKLPQGIKEEEIKASMENGVLTITFPKSGAETAPKKITIG
ncbi:small heat shock protein [Gymnopus androsaceus JB14]|uniref:Small heat shock protein n=1 Tax=Gymnopus androsaceus JB14 TaxID=1447944 RepID=A0A6A4HU06_9AGAR|nr:small heat shock protein [Gymnopus androsaceus JB14]